MTEHRGAITREGELYRSPPARARLPRDRATRAGPCRRQIGDRLWWARIPLPMELNHINVWLMDDGDGWTLVDTGHGRSRSVAKRGARSSAYLQGRPLRRIFITHDHPDHMGLSPLACAQGTAPTCGCRRSRTRPWRPISPRRPGALRGSATYRHLAHGMQMLRRRASAEPAAARRRPGSTACRRWRAAVPMAKSCRVRGRAWRPDRDRRPLPRPPVPARCAAHEVLISGDQVLPTISPNVSVMASRPEGNPLRDFLDVARAARTKLRRGAPWCCRRTASRFAACTAASRSCARITCSSSTCCARPVASRGRRYDLLPVMFGRVLRGFHRLPGARRDARAPALPLARRRNAARTRRRRRLPVRRWQGDDDHGHVAGDVVVGAGGRRRGRRTCHGHVLSAHARARLRGGRQSPRTSACR